MLVAVLALFAGTVWQMATAFPDAGRGLVIYERAQKELFVDAGLIRESYHVRGSAGLASRLRAQTVIVAAQRTPYTAYMGAGVIMSKRRGTVEILTAGHIVDHPGRKFVVFPNHTVERAVRVIRASHDDLALVFVRADPAAAYPTARLAAQTFATGDRFVVMGHPGAQNWTASPGVAERHFSTTLLFCPSCDRGDSGAGAFDRSGALHGIVVTKAVMRAPTSGGYIKLTAFEIEQPEAIRAFMRSAR